MIIGSKIILRNKELADAPNDYAWRADPELAHLDAAPLPTITFAEYLSDYTSQLHYPPATRNQFAIDTPEGKHIGNCVYYGINKRKGKAELGIVIGNRDYWDKGYGTDAVTTLVSHIFHRTNLKRIHLKTLDSNLRAQKCFQRCGFIPYRRQTRDGYSFVFMEIYRRHWEKQQAKT